MILYYSPLSNYCSKVKFLIDYKNIEVDLSSYSTTAAINTMLSNYTTTTNLNTLLGNYATLTALSAYTTTSTLNSLLADKQDVVVNVSDTEMGYLDGVTSGIQSQLDAKHIRSRK